MQDGQVTCFAIAQLVHSEKKKNISNKIFIIANFDRLNRFLNEQYIILVKFMQLPTIYKQCISNICMYNKQLYISYYNAKISTCHTN